MVTAVMNDLFSAAVKQKLEQLEMEKQDLIDRIKYLEINNSLTNTPSKEKVRSFLNKDMNIKK